MSVSQSRIIPPFKNSLIPFTMISGEEGYLAFDSNGLPYIASGSGSGSGNTLLNGSGVPSNSLGTSGDFYIDTHNWYIYGPKTSSWPSGVSLIGPSGTDGSNGTNGTNGTNGAPGTMWYVDSGTPSGSIGILNDLYLNKDNGNFYKKTGSSSWTYQGTLSSSSSSGSSNNYFPGGWT